MTMYQKFLKQLSNFQFKIQNKYFLQMFIYSLSLILKSSPQFLLLNKNLFQKQNSLDFGILSILRWSSYFHFISTLIIILLIIFYFFSIFIWKKGMIAFKILVNLLIPIQFFSIVSNISQNSSKLTIAFYGITSIISYLIIICKFYMFDFRDQGNSLFLIKSLGKTYLMLWDLIMFSNCIFSFFFKGETKIIIIIIQFILVLTKSIILISKINYESPYIEYTAYLCEFGSWISLLSIILYSVYEVNIGLIIWIYYVLVLYYINYENSFLTAMIQKKYSQIINKCSFYSKPHNFQQIQKQQNQLIIFLNIVYYILQTRNYKKIQGQKNYKFLHFSEQFIHQIWYCIKKIELYSSSKQIDKNSYQLKKRKNTKNNTLSLERLVDPQLEKLYLQVEIQKQEKQQGYYLEYYERLWRLVMSLEQVSDQRYQKLRRYICYAIPQINNIFQSRVIYLYYLSYQLQQHPNNLDKNQSKSSYLSKLHQQIDYNFVMKQSKTKATCEYLIAKETVSCANKPRSSQLRNKLVTQQYCLQLQNKYSSNDYEAFYHHKSAQQTLDFKFLEFIEIQKSLINQIQSYDSGYSSIVQKMKKRNTIKNEINDLVRKKQVFFSCKYTINLYMINKYISKLPSIANKHLKIFEQIKQQNRIENQKQISVIGGNNNGGLSNNALFKKMISQNKGIALISGVKNRGNIIYGCKKFKQIMQIKNQFFLSVIQTKEGLNFNHFMLPCWIQKHQKIMESCKIYENNFLHTQPTKYHMKSMISKRVYQIDFTIHYITSKMEDLYMVLDINYKYVDFLQIIKIQSSQSGQTHKRVFYRDHSPLNQNRIQLNFTSQGHIQNIVCCQSHNRTYFGQQYRINTQYVQQHITQKQSTKTLISRDVQQQKMKQSIWHFKDDKYEDKLQNQKKLLQYRKSNSIFKKQFYLFLVIILILIVAFVIIVGVFSNLIHKQQDDNKSLYQFTHKIRDHFLLTDMKSSNSFFTMVIPNNKNINFTSTSQLEQFQQLWYLVIKQEISNLRRRLYDLQHNFIQNDQGIKILFEASKQSQNSFYYQQQRYTVKFFQTLNNIDIYQNIQQNMLSNKLQKFPNIKQDLNKVQLNDLIRFYIESLEIYDKYYQEDGIIYNLEQYQRKNLSYQERHLTILYIIILIMIFVGCLVLGYLYYRFQFFTKIKLIELMFGLSNDMLYKMKDNVQQLQDLITQSNSIINKTIYQTIRTTHQMTLRRKTDVMQRKISNIMKYKTKRIGFFRISWKQILVFFILILGLMLILQSNIQDAKNQINNFYSYSIGADGLNDITTKNMYIFKHLIDAILSIKRPLDPRIQTMLAQMKEVNRLQMASSIQPDEQIVVKMFFQSWCQTNYSQIRCYDTISQKQSFMQTLSNNQIIYQRLYKKIQRHGQGKVLFQSSQIVDMYKYLVHFVQMVRIISHQVKQNYFGSIKNLNVYLVYNGIFISMIIVLSGLWIYKKMFRQTKVYFEEILTMITFKQMEYVPAFSIFIHQSERQTIEKQIQ